MLNKPPVMEKRLADLIGRIEHSQLRNKSLFNPQVHNNEHINVFNKIVIRDIEKLKIKRMKDPQDIGVGEK